MGAKGEHHNSKRDGEAVLEENRWAARWEEKSDTEKCMRR